MYVVMDLNYTLVIPYQNILLMNIKDKRTGHLKRKVVVSEPNSVNRCGPWLDQR